MKSVIYKRQRLLTTIRNLTGKTKILDTEEHRTSVGLYYIKRQISPRPQFSGMIITHSLRYEAPVSLCFLPDPHSFLSVASDRGTQLEIYQIKNYLILNSSNYLMWNQGSVCHFLGKDLGFSNKWLINMKCLKKQNLLILQVQKNKTR